MSVWDEQPPGFTPDLGSMDTSQPMPTGQLFPPAYSSADANPAEFPAMFLGQSQQPSFNPVMEIPQPDPQMMGPQATPPPKRNDMWKGLLSNALYSFSQGLLASSQARPGAPAESAALGGALFAPYQRQAEQRKAALEQAHQQEMLARAKADENRYSMVTVVNPATGEPIQMPQSSVPSYLAAVERMKQTAATAQRQGDIAQQRADTMQQETERKAKQGMLTLNANLRKQRLKWDENTNQAVPISDSELTPLEKLQDEQKTAAIDHTKALTDVARLSADPKSPQFKLKLQQLYETSRRNDILAIRTHTAQMNTDASLLGTVDGKPLPGGPKDYEGNPIGLKIYTDLIPVAQRTRASQADIIELWAKNFKKDLEKVRDKIGPGVGHLQEVYTKFGMQDPDIAALKADMESFSALQPIIHGYRGGVETHRVFLDAMAGNLHTNADAINSAVDQLVKMARTSKIASGATTPASSWKGGPLNKSHTVGKTSTGMSYTIVKD